MPIQIEVTIPKPLEWQQTVMREARRFNVVCIGRRAGKTELGKILCIQPEVMRYPIGWFSPIYKDMLEVWRSVTETLRPIAKRINGSERRVELVTGGVVEFWSLDNPNSGRGRKYKRVIIDEAAFVSGLMDSWHMAILPTLADYSGDAWIFSTPKGRNAFHALWSMHQSHDDWQAWQMPTTVNPHISDAEIEIMRQTMPERVFQQEVMAQFLDDAGGVFRGVMDCATAQPQTTAVLGHSYIIGVDWGKHNDFTVITVLDTTTNELVYIDRFNQIDYTLQRQRLVSCYQTFKPIAIYAERNSIGDPNIEQLQSEGLPVQPFNTSAASKKQAIEALALAFERREIKIIPDATLINELQSYETERLPSGTLRYSAPAGLHDDCVMSLAIAWHAIANYQPLIW